MHVGGAAVRRDHARRRFDEVEGTAEQTLAGYLALLRELPPAAVADRSSAWKVQATETFVEALIETALGALPASVDEVARERLRDAVLAGPAAVAEHSRGLAEDVEEAEQPQAELERLARLRVCLELRLRCLEHLESVFGSERAQP
jgi:hypothetical protein